MHIVSSFTENVKGGGANAPLTHTFEIKTGKNVYDNNFFTSLEMKLEKLSYRLQKTTKKLWIVCKLVNKYQFNLIVTRSEVVCDCVSKFTSTSIGEGDQNAVPLLHPKRFSEVISMRRCIAAVR